MQKGKIFIISGPSGVGKDTIIKGVMRKLPDLIMVKSYTTRPPRQSDEAGNRIFVSEEKFKEMIKNGEMIEWQKVHDKWFYSRRRDDVMKPIKKGKNVIMDVNVDGTVYYEKIMPEVVSIFIKYESPDLFENRLRKYRPEITQEELETRKKSFKHEMTFEKYYDYSVINPENQPEKTINVILSIITKKFTRNRKIII